MTENLAKTDLKYYDLKWDFPLGGLILVSISKEMNDLDLIGSLWQSTWGN